MDNWHTLAIIALIHMGTQSFFYKVSAARSCNTAWTTFSFMATVALLSSVLFVFGSEPVPKVAFTLIIGLHFVIAILLSVLMYKEKFTPPVIAGISLTILSVILRH